MSTCRQTAILNGCRCSAMHNALVKEAKCTSSHQTATPKQNRRCSPMEHDCVCVTPDIFSQIHRVRYHTAHLQLCLHCSNVLNTLPSRPFRPCGCVRVQGVAILERKACRGVRAACHVCVRVRAHVCGYGCTESRFWVAFCLFEKRHHFMTFHSRSNWDFGNVLTTLFLRPVPALAPALISASRLVSVVVCRTHAQAHAHTCTCTYTYTNTNTHTHTHTRTRTCTHTRAGARAHTQNTTTSVHWKHSGSAAQEY